MLPPAATATIHATALLHYIMYNSTITTTFDKNDNIAFQEEYLQAVQLSFQYQSTEGHLIALQWIDISKLSAIEFDEQILRAVDMVVTEGFVVILSNTLDFLHARYYATRNSELRLKDKFYLFLCVYERPQDFLTTEILQFYPHHVMVVPVIFKPATTKIPESKHTTITSKTTTKSANNHRRITLNKFNTLLFTTTTWDKLKCLKYDDGDDDDDDDDDGCHSNTCSQWNSTGSSHVKGNTYNNAEDAVMVEEIMRKRATYSHRDINFELWTQKFVGNDGNLEAQLLDAFLPNETFVRNVELYPNKVSNLEGRTLRVGSITYIPYVVTNYVDAGTGNVDAIDLNAPNRTISYMGSEAEVLKTFCQVRNCHLLVEPYGVDNWGIIYDNETSNGMLGGIYTQHVEVAIGCIYNWYNNVTETSHTIARSAVTILGPAPEQFAAWRTNIMPFTSGLWSFLITTMLMCACVLHFIKFLAFQLTAFHYHNHNQLVQQQQQRQFYHLKAFDEAILDIFAVFIQQPSASTSLDTFAARFFLATLLCATITLENTYSGQLKSILTIPFYMEPVDTMEKWSQTTWKWSAPSIVWVQTVEKSHLLKEQILTRKFEVHDYEFLYNASFRPDYGLGIERLQSGDFSFGHFITAQALDTKIVPKDDLYFDWTRAVSIRGWPLMHVFNRHVRTCMETGLFVHWERQIVAQYLDRQAQDIMLKLASGHTCKMPPQTLNVENISGALFVLLFGYIIALAIFLCECLTHSIKTNIERRCKHFRI